MSASLKKNIQPKPADPIVHKDTPVNIPAWAPWVVVLLTGIIYYRALYGELTSIDDDFYILKNPYLRDFSWNGMKEIFTSFYQTNYHPLTTLTYFFEYHWFGLDPFPYHLLNVVLHLVNTWLVFKLCEELSGKRLTALIVAVLFALHPMHVESVAWVAERKDVLYSMFYLLSLLYYLRSQKAGFNMSYYLGALLFFLASLFSKSAAVTLPVILVVIDLYKGRKFTTRSILEKVPFFLLALLFGILAILSQRAGGAINDYAGSTSLLNKVFIFTSSIAFYILKVLAPFGLSVLHYSPYVLGSLQWQYYASVPFLVLIAWLVLRPSPWRKELLFGVSFFLAAVSVMLQIIPVGSAYVAERYTYISYIGLFYIIGQLISGIHAAKQQKMALIVLSGVVIVFSAKTWDRIGVWKNDSALFDDLVESNPEIYSAYSLRADIKKKQGDLQGAVEDYSKAIELNPGYADTYYKRALVYDIQNNVKAAIADYNKTTELQPNFTAAYNNRGWDLYRSGNAAAAMADYNKTIELEPNYAEAYNNRGWAYYQAGSLQLAAADFSKAIALIPGFDKPYYNRAEIRVKTGDLKGALEDYNVILKIHPDDNSTYYLCGLACAALKDTAAACPYWKKSAEMGNQQAAQMAGNFCR